MKKTIVSILVLVVLTLGSFYTTGLVTQRTFDKSIGMFDQSSGLAVKVVKYERGLFSSQAQLLWQVQTPERLTQSPQGSSTLIPAKTYSIDMPVTIYHGPIIYANNRLYFGLGFANSDVDLPEFDHYFQPTAQRPHITMTWLVTYFNETRMHLSVPAFQWVTKTQHIKFEWLGMQSDDRFSSMQDHFSGVETLNGVRVTQDTLVAFLDKMTATIDVHRALKGMYVGEIAIDAPAFSVMRDSKALFDAKGFKLLTSSEVENHKFGSSLDVSFSTLMLHEKSYGPARFQFMMKNLDADVLAELNQKINQIQSLPILERQQALFTLIPVLPKLLDQGASIGVTVLNLVTPEGIVDGSFKLTFPHEVLANPFQLLQKIQGNGHLKLPASTLKAILYNVTKYDATEVTLTPNTTEGNTIPITAVPTATGQVADTTAVVNSAEAPASATPTDPEQKWVAQVEDKLANLIKVGVLVVDGDDYRITISLSEGQLLVNNHPFSTDMLKF